MKTVFVVFGKNDILHAIGPVGGATTEQLAKQLEERQQWKLDMTKVFPVQIAENEEDLKEWMS